MITVTKEQLRNFYINYHFGGLYDLSEQDAIKAIFDRIQSVQFDPLNVAGRNAELVLFSRNKNITKDTIHSALYKDRTLIDGWDKMMSIYPTRFFPHFRHIREQAVKQYALIMSWRNQTECHAYTDEMYSYIQKNGPVLVSDIPSPKTHNCNWGPSKVAGVCCEYLWNDGKIAVADKKGVVKVYDTTEKLLGEKANEQVFSDEHEFLLWYVKRRIAAVGAVWDKNGGAWLGHYVEKSDSRSPIIAELTEKGELIQINIENENIKLYVCADALEYFEKSEKSRTILVAPLDNLIWDRKLINKVFDFDYSWEVYVPAAKRKFGYYVLPIIIGNEFVGRLEPVQYKPNEKFTIKNIWYESNYKPKDGDADTIAQELTRLAHFLDVDIDENIKDKLVHKQM